MNKNFNYLIPLYTFLFSGWFIAIYLAILPGFNKMMSEVPEGTVLNAVPPTMWLGMFVTANIVGWMIVFIPTGVDE